MLDRQGYLEEAKEYYERALSIWEESLGPQHPNVASSYNKFADVLVDQGDRRQAKEYYERALSIT